MPRKVRAAWLSVVTTYHRRQAACRTSASDSRLMKVRTANRLTRFQSIRLVASRLRPSNSAATNDSDSSVLALWKAASASGTGGKAFQHGEAVGQ